MKTVVIEVRCGGVMSEIFCDDKDVRVVVVDHNLADEGSVYPIMVARTEPKSKIPKDTTELLQKQFGSKKWDSKANLA